MANDGLFRDLEKLRLKVEELFRDSGIIYIIIIILLQYYYYYYYYSSRILLLV